jgi:hypothetical protein
VEFRNMSIWQMAVNPYMSDINLLLYHSDMKHMHKKVHASKPFNIDQVVLAEEIEQRI